MRREMFEDVVEPSVGAGARKWYSIPLSIVSHVVLVAALVIAPLTATDMFPTPQSVLVFAMAPPAPSVPPPVALTVLVPVAETTALNANAAPLSAPEGIHAELPATLAAAAPPPPLSPSGPAVAMAPQTSVTLATAPPPTGPIPVGGAVREPRKTHHVPPVYPAVALAARREGTVILEATIDKDGAVRDARVLRSDVLFDQAALAAVRQWRYTAPTLNGIAIDVTMTVTVRFSMR